MAVDDAGRGAVAVEQNLKCRDILARAEGHRRLDGALDDARIGGRRAFVEWSALDLRRASRIRGPRRRLASRVGARPGIPLRARRERSRADRPHSPRSAGQGGSDLARSRLQPRHILRIVEIVAAPRVRAWSARRGDAPLGAARPLDAEHLAGIGIDDDAAAELRRSRFRRRPIARASTLRPRGTHRLPPLALPTGTTLQRRATTIRPSRPKARRSCGTFPEISPFPPPAIARSECRFCCNVT